MKTNIKWYPRNRYGKRGMYKKVASSRPSFSCKPEYIKQMKVGLVVSSRGIDKGDCQQQGERVGRHGPKPQINSKANNFRIRRNEP